MTDPAHSSTILDTLIVGAGISGLSLAHALQQEKTQTRPLEILVVESQGRVGGNITTASAEGFLWEEGPNSFAPTPELMKLTVEAGLKQELVLADRKLPRYVYWNGRLQAVPMSPPALIQSNLLSFPGKLRALVGALGFVGPAIGASLSQQQGEETVSQFFERHLGSEVTKRLVEPFVSGVYAGNAQQLSAAAAFGRVVKMAEVGGGLVPGAVLVRRQTRQTPTPKRPAKIEADLPQTRPGELGSFRQGLQALPEALAGKLAGRLKLNWHLMRLQPTDHQTYLAEFSTPEGHRQIEARTVVITTPAYVTSEVLHAFAPQASAALAKIDYPPVACVVVAYPASAMDSNLTGFGNLIPRGQGIRTLGTIWSSSLFPGRTPAGWRMLTNFIGGATDPEIADLDTEGIAQAVHQDLRKLLLRPDAPPPKVLTVNLWKRAIPQYTLGHQQRLEQIKRNLNAFPGLYLCSNYLDGVALGDCARRGFSLASEVRQYLLK